MRVLQRCDFCDAEAVGAFETVPPELATAGVENRRIVLCNHCRDVLEGVLEPLLAAVSDEVERGELDSIDRLDRDVKMGEPADTGDGDPLTDAEAETADSVTGDEGADAMDKGADTTDEGAETADEGADTTDEDVTTTDEDAETADPVDETGEITFDDSTSDRSKEATTHDAATNRDDRPPTGYGKVLRLLQNREFPVKRDTAEALAAGAYDLETHEVDAIMEYALDRGEFVEERGKLKRP